MEKKYIMALDQGTTSSRAVLFDHQQQILGVEQKEFTQFYPQEAWVEHDPMELYSSQYAVMMELLTRFDIGAEEIAAIGIANQRETTIMWDAHSGRPIYNAIVWQCRRTSPLVDALVDEGLGDYIKKVSGLVPDAYFSATKIKWILEHVEGAREKARRGEILFGTVDTWLIWKLTGAHVTDYTNASRTMLFNIHTLDWDDTLLAALDIPRAVLPELIPSSHICGMVNIQGTEVPLAAAVGDQQSALFGQCCFSKGEAKNTYGTGCFLLMNTGSEALESRHGLLTTIAAGVDKKVQYVLEGSVFVGGAVIQWLRDELRFITESSDAEYYAGKVSDTGGVYLVPAFTGLGAPYWDMYARGAILGITRGTRREHIIRAAEEAIAYQSLDLLRAMEKDSGLLLGEIKVDGGASRDAVLLQFQADISGARIHRPVVRETTALGAAYLAGLATGFWQSLDELRATWRYDKTFTPAIDEKQRAELIGGWHKAVERIRGK
ncbi:MAG: glycerol kinase GlpK [Treponema sp.]|jgi:glycerol kinase|nr:glycerol kinase GlpK [Treponema sp.]